MDERNIVTVVVYGQEYTLAADMPREYILKIADHLDSKMREIGEGSNEPISKIAVLAGIIIADEYFKQNKEIDDLLAENIKLDQDAKNYERLWNEVKENFAQNQSELSAAVNQRNNMQDYVRNKDAQINALSAEVAQEKKYNQELRNRIEELLSKQRAADEIPPEVKKHIEELENTCRDREASYFDIQMENIHLKTELDNLRGRK